MTISPQVFPDLRPPDRPSRAALPTKRAARISSPSSCLVPLRKQLYVTLHSDPRGVKEIASKLHTSPGYLYRCVLDGESGCRFPLDLLPELMQATGDFRVLDFLNAVSGRISVSLGRARALKRKNAARVLLELEKSFNSLMIAVVEYFSKPEPASLPTVKAELRRHLSDLGALRLALDSLQQLELF